MDKHISLATIILISHILLTHFRVANCGNEIPISTQTPSPKKTLDQNAFNLWDINLRATLAQATNSHNLISQMDSTSFNQLSLSAWRDCVELYADTIYQLNRSMVSKTNAVDAQTWLSAAIANEQACYNGFHDFNITSHLESFKISDLSNLLSNSLAMNKAMASENNINRRLLAHDHLPDWVSAGDRRLLASESIKADMVVAQDGSGDFTTISEALGAAAKQKRGLKRFVIYVKKGVYKENVEVKRSMRNLMLIGDGIDATIVIGNKNVYDGSTTFRSATFASSLNFKRRLHSSSTPLMLQYSDGGSSHAHQQPSTHAVTHSGVSGDGFIARDMTFENTAGPHKHQAVALRSSSDFSIFYRCSFKGYQDTLYVHSQRQFYRECDIYGTIDFIFGDAVAVIQNCNIYVRKPMTNQKNTVTAQGRKDPNENTGIVIHNSLVKPTFDLRTVQDSYKSYLGRPWKQYSRTVFMKCVIDGFIDPLGWLPWSGDFGLNTLCYGEYMNTGSGASTSGRVKWPGFHDIRSAVEAGKFSVREFLAGDSWIPAAGVPFTSDV